jgi:hypothetical protein
MTESALLALAKGNQDRRAHCVNYLAQKQIEINAIFLKR